MPPFLLKTPEVILILMAVALLLLVSSMAMTRTRSDRYLFVDTNMFAGFGDNVRRYYDYFKMADMLKRTLVLPPFSVNAADGTTKCEGLDPAKLRKQAKKIKQMHSPRAL